ncbi:glycosyltransferase family 25 protein [Antarcticirhabdus aurantiaca]|uniref:Uncharacterized protein n=1 Tax=Antarcticirhabdus aurantiaca TaxID=2606717 RepID=A0ACD4NVV2_9HYPH|nr:LPS biosynthesis glycosyltransferase [Antarcticirhabdus aurantiaca]WAJ31111.1 hypothetical protein OXU80_13290 [Jeongeuplla avenae]
MLQRFERRFVINLPHRVDRRRDTEAELVRVGCSATFVAAIRPADAGEFGSVGERGAYESHLRTWRSAIGAGSILVMEDDVSFAPDLRDRVALLDALPTAWDVLYLGHGQLPDVPRHRGGPGLGPVEPETEFIGLHCYAINGRALPRLVAAAERFLTRERGHPDGGIMPIDGALNIARRQEGFVTFAAVPPLAEQRASRTDIGTLKWFDRVPALEGAVRLARRAKNAARFARRAGPETPS